MVEINNQRKAFSICWRGRRELITDVETRNRADVIAGGELLLITPITLTDLSRMTKLKSTGAGRLTFPVGGMPTASSLA